VVPFAVATDRDDVPAWVQGGRVVADEGVREVEGFAQERLVEEPRSAGEGAGGFAGHPGFEFLRRNAAERRDQDRQVGGLGRSSRSRNQACPAGWRLASVFVSTVRATGDDAGGIALGNRDFSRVSMMRP